MFFIKLPVLFINKKRKLIKTHNIISSNLSWQQRHIEVNAGVHIASSSLMSLEMKPMELHHAQLG